MKKTIVVVLALVLVLGFSAMVFAETTQSFGNGKYTQEEYQAKMIELKKAQLDIKVDAGIITQDEADTFLADMKDRMENCDGTGVGLGRGGMGMGRGRAGQGRMMRNCTVNGK